MISDFSIRGQRAKKRYEPLTVRLRIYSQFHHLSNLELCDQPTKQIEKNNEYTDTAASVPSLLRSLSDDKSHDAHPAVLQIARDLPIRYIHVRFAQ